MTSYDVRRSNGSVVRALTDRQTHTHTEGQDRFYYLDRVADAGGNNNHFELVSQHIEVVAYGLVQAESRTQV